MTQAPETPAARRRRLRWLSFAEVIGAASLVIAGLSYWDTHRDRVTAETARPAVPVPLLLTATASADKASLLLRPARPDAVIQTQQLIVPGVTEADSTDITGDPRIDVKQVERVIRTDVHKDRVAAPPRLPVGLVTVYIEGGATRRDIAIYDIAYHMRGRLLQPYAIELRGIGFARRATPGDVNRLVQARWAAATK